jgi:hypothetical protein
MKDKLLITVAAAALLAGSNLALAQGKPPATGGAQMDAPPATGGAQMNAPPAGAPSKDAVEPGRADTGSKPMTSERPAAAEDSKRKPSTAQGSEGGKAPATAQGSQGSKPSASAQANVNLTSEQRTKIHSVVIKEKNAPRVASVNFKLTVGTVVPKSVHVIAVPASIVEIQPAWRGFMYFLVGNQVVIVEPGTLRIVAVIAA